MSRHGRSYGTAHDGRFQSTEATTAQNGLSFVSGQLTSLPQAIHRATLFHVLPEPAAVGQGRSWAFSASLNRPPGCSPWQRREDKKKVLCRTVYLFVIRFFCPSAFRIRDDPSAGSPFLERATNKSPNARSAAVPLAERATHKPPTTRNSNRERSQCRSTPPVTTSRNTRKWNVETRFCTGSARE